MIPWEGGGDKPPVPEMIEAWATLCGCSHETEVVHQKGEVTSIEHQDCENDTTLRICIIEGGGHYWPGAVDLYNMNPDLHWWAGHTTEDIDTSRAIWKFFAEHAMCDDECECDEE
jgi:polyhydroxybutyrate depolymerase